MAKNAPTSSNVFVITEGMKKQSKHTAVSATSERPLNAQEVVREAAWHEETRM